MEKLFTAEQTAQYLKKMGLAEKPAPTFETLCTLQKLQMQTFPYENLDCMAQKLLSLAPDALFAKLIEGTRGGISVELDTAFCLLLKSLGFEVTSYTACRFDIDGAAQPKVQRINSVKIDEKEYICCTGINCEAPRIPLPLEYDTEQSDEICSYRFTKDQTLGTILEQKEGFFWSPLYAFGEAAENEQVFSEALRFCIEEKASPCNKSNKISIFTSDTFIFIAADTLKYKKQGRIIKQLSIEDRRQMNKLLSAVFHISFGEIKFVNTD